jgi:hypothetical protein
MTPLLFLSTFLCLAADPSAAPATALKFKDSATCHGRPAVYYRAVEFRDTPVRPLEDGQKFPAGAKYGLLPIGPKPETGLMIVWIPKDNDKSVLWLDADGNGNLTDEERHVLSGKKLEIPASITVQVQPEKQQAKRTLLFRRSAQGDGLRYAVRGYAQGRLKLGEKEFDAALVDGNADGCLNTVGHDRVWIDLDGNGRFDLLTEQYPLGKPITLDGQVYVVRSNPLADEVVVNLRSVGEGKLRLALAAKSGSPGKIEAELVSDIGEFLPMEKLNEFVSVPYGEYRFSALQLEVPDAKGKLWSYRFSGEQPRNYTVPLNRETTIELLKHCLVNVQMLTEEEKIKPGGEIQVRPEIIADECLSLGSCSTRKKDAERGSDVEAEVLLLDPAGKTVHRSVAGFG